MNFHLLNSDFFCNFVGMNIKEYINRLPYGGLRI